MTESGPRVDSLPGCLLMMFATIGGYMALGALAILIFRRSSWQLSALDIAYWVLAAAVAVAQHIWRRQQAAGSSPPLAVGRLTAHFGVVGLIWVLAQSIHLTA
jgi:hypothetical protein